MACNTINSSIGIFTLAILAVLIVAVALGDDTRRSRMAFAAVLTLHAVNTFGGLLAQRFTGLDDTFSIMMTYIGNYGTYMVGPVAVTGFILLACANLPTDLSPKARRTTTGLIVTPGVLNMLLIILNPWTGWAFRIGEGNAFVWGPLHMLPDDMAALQMLVSLLVVPLANAGGAKHVLLQWLALFMLPIAAGIVENRHDSLTLMYPAIAFSLMILFILRRQSNEERRILAEHELAESKAKLFTEQLHPHFIFNSLTAIQELCMEDSTRARKAVQELSVYLRGNIDAVRRIPTGARAQGNPACQGIPRPGADRHPAQHQNILEHTHIGFPSSATQHAAFGGACRQIPSSIRVRSGTRHQGMAR